MDDPLSGIWPRVGAIPLALGPAFVGAGGASDVVPLLDDPFTVQKIPGWAWVFRLWQQRSATADDQRVAPARLPAGVPCFNIRCELICPSLPRQLRDPRR